MDKLEATLTRGLSSIFVIVPINSSIAGPTQAEQQLKLMQAETADPHRKGCSAWLADGISLQEAQ